jgi:hypothetical protein
MELINDFLSWLWARHHNQLSWYIRPLFLLPFCYFAYRRSVWGIVVILLVFPTSLFWFLARVWKDTLRGNATSWSRAALSPGLPLCCWWSGSSSRWRLRSGSAAGWGPGGDQRGHAAQGDLERHVRGRSRVGFVGAISILPGGHRRGHPAGSALVDSLGPAGAWCYSSIPPRCTLSCHSRCSWRGVVPLWL